MRKNHRRIAEGLEFKTISSRIFDKESSLFTRFIFKSDFRFQQEFDPGSFQAICQIMPFLPFQNCAEMRDGYRITIDISGTGIGSGTAKNGALSSSAAP